MPSSSATRGAPPAPRGRRRPIGRISPIPRSVAGFRLAVEGDRLPDRHRPLLRLAAVGRRRQRVRRPHQRLRDDPVRPQPRLRPRGAQAQLDQGIEIGPQTPLAGEVAARVAAMVGMERVAFCNTGSEAVTAAIRARPHGQRPGPDRDVRRRLPRDLRRGPRPLRRADRSMPIAPGIPPSMVDNVVVLDYGEPEPRSTT